MEVEQTEQCVGRSIKGEIAVLSRPDGSALLAQGNTVVIAGIYGPVEGKLQNCDIYKAYVEVLFSSKSGLPTVKDRLKEAIIRQTCEAALITSYHPRMAISINVQEMQDDGGLMACALNACCLALIHSGLSMNFVFASSYCTIKEDGTILLDPSNRETGDCVAELTFTFDSKSKNIISCSTSGNFSSSQYKECMFKCRSACDKIFDYYRDLVTKYSKTIL